MNAIQRMPGLYVIAVTAVVFAGDGPQYDLSWNTIDGGGATLTGGDFQLDGSIGQPDASQVLGGGAFSLSGGFWPGGIACPWDCDGSGDGMVDTNDFLALLAQWGLSDTSCDFGLGVPGIGANEFLDLLANWGPCP